MTNSKSQNPKSKKIPNFEVQIPNWRTGDMGNLDSEVCLGFGIWTLEFRLA
jgi:hypothetical protein